MAVKRVTAGRGAAGQVSAAVGCWGGCWYGGCWGGCWPGLEADVEVVRSLADSLSRVEGAPPDLRKVFTPLREGLTNKK